MNLLQRPPFLLTATALAVAVLPLGTPTAGAESAAPRSGQVRLVRDPGSVVGAAEVRLGPAQLTHVAGTRQARTERLATSTYELVAVTWRGDADPPRIRTHTEGAWSGWHELPLLTDVPDLRSGEGNGITGTDLLWVGRSDGIQVAVRGPRPADLTLQLIDPGVLPTDADAVAQLPAQPPAPAPAGSGRTAKHGKGAPRPPLLYRGQWGADESWRNGGPRFGRTIQQVHLHHTATGNDYSRADVPGLLRGMYRYHTQTLGWSDIGYNFLVDRFGRTWVGRAGGVAKIVRGAHTLGFNDTSVGIAVIGNYETAWPTEPVITAIVRLAAWKLDAFHRKPTGWARVYSHGSDRFAAGRTVTLRVIDGHRDTNDTACPGAHLYSQLTKIRNRTQLRVDAW